MYFIREDMLKIINLRIPGETNTDSGLKANTDSGFSRTVISDLVERFYQITKALLLTRIQSVKFFDFSAWSPLSIQGEWSCEAVCLRLRQPMWHHSNVHASVWWVIDS